MKNKIKAIPLDIEKKIKYLVDSFSNALKPHESKEDLKQDLRVVYIEKYNPNRNINEWFIIFKNCLIDKYRSLTIERKKLKEYKQIWKN